MDKNVRRLTRTAVLLALTVIFQLLGRYIPLGPNSNFVVGPLVNACLIIAAASTGLWGGAVIAVLSPFTALITGGAIPVPFLPFIAAGNFVLVLLFYLLRKTSIIGVLAGSLVKFAFLYGSVLIFLSFYKVPPKLAAVLLFLFSWPQLVTALIGGLVALIVIRMLGRNIEL